MAEGVSRTLSVAGAKGRAVVAGVLFMLCAGLASSVLHIGVRLLGPELPVFVIVVVRAIVTSLTALPFVLRSADVAWRTRRPGLQLLRGFVAAGSICSWYYALTTMPLATANVLSFTTAIFVTIGAAVVFGEPVGIRRWTAVVVGLAGTVIVLKPGVEVVSWGAIAALASSMLWGTAMLLAKELSKSDSSLTIAFYQPLLTLPFVIVGAIPVWVTPSASALVILIGMGVLAFAANYSYIQALRLADASIVMPADYMRLVWATLWGYLVFSEIPDVTVGVGAALIAGSTFFITIRERQIANAAQGSDSSPQRDKET